MVSEFLSIHSTDNLRLARSLQVKELHVHLGRPGPTVEVGDHALEYVSVEFHGRGAFTVTRHGKQMWKVER